MNLIDFNWKLHEKKIGQTSIVKNRLTQINCTRERSMQLL